MVCGVLKYRSEAERNTGLCVCSHANSFAELPRGDGGAAVRYRPAASPVGKASQQEQATTQLNCCRLHCLTR
jgi:hypothetical protein